MQHFLGGATTAVTPRASQDDDILRISDEAVGRWEAIDFGNFQLSLEDQAAELVEMQEKRLNQRKELADKTNAAKARLDSAGADLVKLYQRALEDVTVQAKHGTNAFLTAYKMLRELPDPVGAMDLARRNIALCQARIKQLEEREDSLVVALRASREKAKGAEELRAERDQFREEVQLDGMAKLEAERVAAQEKLAVAHAHYDEEMAKLQSQLDLALEEVERLKLLEASSKDGHESSRFRPRTNSSDINQARSEGYATAERILSAKLEEAARLAEASSREYLLQLEELRATISGQIEQIGDLKAEVARRPDPGEVQRLKNQLMVVTRLTSDNPQLEDGTEAVGSLDGLEAWLLSTNQRLVRELSQAKEDLAKFKSETELQQRSAEVPAELMNSTRNVDDDLHNAAALKSQRDRLRAVLEKRDLEIERLRNQLDERDQKARKIEDEVDKLRQRVRFLQSYKVSEKSTLLPVGSAVNDVETGPSASLGRGVGHEFRALWEAERKTRLVEIIRMSLFGRSRDLRIICFFGYFGLIHLWLLWLLLWHAPSFA
jgi:hypothetical protein